MSSVQVYTRIYIRTCRLCLILLEKLQRKQVGVFKVIKIFPSALKAISIPVICAFCSCGSQLTLKFSGRQHRYIIVIGLQQSTFGHRPLQLYVS